jgi:hypothetical protein
MGKRAQRIPSWLGVDPLQQRLYTLFDRTEFTYQPESDTFLCPAGQTLARKQLMRKDRAVLYAAQSEICGACPRKSRCTVSPRRIVTRHLHEEALQRMQ